MDHLNTTISPEIDHKSRIKVVENTQ